jgi:hypothetical protein
MIKPKYSIAGMATDEEAVRAFNQEVLRALPFRQKGKNFFNA